MKIRIFLITIVSILLLGACSGSGGGSVGGGSPTPAPRATVSCASGSLCPPAQVNAVNPNTN